LLGDAAAATHELGRRIPEGLTIVQATGQWQKRNSAVTREAYDGSGQALQRVAAIAAEYKTRYRQESVLVTRARIAACF
jgi:hypothetical protein